MEVVFSSAALREVKEAPNARDYALAFLNESARTPRLYLWYFAVLAVYGLFYRWHAMLERSEGWWAIETMMGILFVLALVYPVWELIRSARIAAKLFTDEK